LREARIVSRGGALAGGAKTWVRRGQSFDRMSISSGIIDAFASERRGKEAAFARAPNSATTRRARMTILKEQGILIHRHCASAEGAKL
jgi:hypothetical protein